MQNQEQEIKTDIGARETVLANLIVGKNVSASREITLNLAIELGADQATLETLRDGTQISRGPTAVLSAHRYEGLSRGRGWCRMGRGDNAKWGERTDNGYRVGPGKWIVGATDGFSRKGSIDWTVKNIKVGDQIWTIAD